MADSAVLASYAVVIAADVHDLNPKACPKALTLAAELYNGAEKVAPPTTPPNLHALADSATSPADLQAAADDFAEHQARAAGYEEARRALRVATIRRLVEETGAQETQIVAILAGPFDLAAAALAEALPLLPHPLTADGIVATEDGKVLAAYAAARKAVAQLDQLAAARETLADIVRPSESGDRDRRILRYAPTTDPDRLVATRRMHDEITRERRVVLEPWITLARNDVEVRLSTEAQVDDLLDAIVNQLANPQHAEKVVA